MVLLPCRPLSSASTTAHSEPSGGGVGYPPEATQPPNQKRVCEEANGLTSAAPEETTVFQKGTRVHDGGLETLEKQQILVCIISLIRQESMQYIL